MSFDKVKAMRTAERFLSQGKIRAAISEYKRIVEHDPKDFSTMNILGDLYAKGNESTEAVTCFKQVAEHYSKQGFAQKAIAIYNKISRLEPNSADVSEKLAQLYQSRGSFAEARNHYVVLADQYQRRGQKTEALEIWKQIAKLDPNNTEVYLKIAEFCQQNGQKDEAAKAYTEAGMRLAGSEQFESALTAFSRALEIRQYDLAALNGYVKAQIKLGYAEDAAQRLEKILEQSPYNREILYLLVDCHLESNNPAEAEKAVIRLVEQEPANYPKFIELVEIYIKNSDLEAAARILSMSSEHMLVGGKHNEFLHWVNEILARDPEQIEALRLSVRYYGWQRDENELRKSLERLAEIARLHEQVDDERYALSQLVMIVPHEIEYARRLQEINYEFGGANYLSTENFAEAIIAKKQKETPQFGSFEMPENEAPAPAFSGDFDSERVSTDLLEEQPPLFTYDESLNGYDSPVERVDSFFEEPDSPETSSEIYDEAVENSLPDVQISEMLPVGLSISDELRLAQEIESIEFYVAQGYKELADKSLCALEAEFGERPEFDLLREQMDDSLQKIAETATLAKSLPETLPADEIAAPEMPVEKVENLGSALPDFHSSLNFLDEFRAELGLEESESDAPGDYETHYQTATAYQEMGLLEDAIREFQDAINLVRAADGTRRFFQCCNLLGHCFMSKAMPNLALMWFRRALETPDLNDEENQAVLYEIANAFEVGGEVPKAVEYFEQIYAVNVDYRDVGVRLKNLHVANPAG